MLGEVEGSGKSGQEESRIVKEVWRGNKLATLYKCNSSTGKMSMVETPVVIVVRVRGSLMGIRTLTKGIE